MSHQTEVIAVDPLPVAGLLAITVRCCGDPSTDQVLTLGGLSRTVEEIDADLAKHQQKVANDHEGHQRAKEHLERLMKKVGA